MIHENAPAYDSLLENELQIYSLIQLLTINEQILKFAQSYPTNAKTSSSDAPFLIN